MLALLLLLVPLAADAVRLKAVVSQHGVRGEVVFAQDTTTQVTLDLSVLEDEAEGEYSWGIYEFPVDYSSEDFCDAKLLGRKAMVDLDQALGKLTLMANSSEDSNVTVSNKATFSSDAFSLVDSEASIWGRSLLLEGPSKRRICASIMPDESSDDEKLSMKVSVARFSRPITGTVHIMSLSKGDSVESKIVTNVFHSGSKGSSQNKWQLFITDILESETESSRKSSSCDFLQLVFDPNNVGSAGGCGKDSRDKCRQGDLTGKFGEVRVGGGASGGTFTRDLHTDMYLDMPELDGPRSVYLAIYDDEHPDSFLACARLFDIKPKKAKATFATDGITGDIAFAQQTSFHATQVRVKLNGLNEGAGGYHIHEFPVPPRINKDDTPCARTANHFNPTKIDKSASPPSGAGSFDRYEIGDLSGKYGELKALKEVDQKLRDPTVSLFGRYSIVGRSIVLHQTPVPNRWACTNIEPVAGEKETMITAAAEFTYPIVGRIVFRQSASDPYSDTMVHIESLLYSDGSKNDTAEHRWNVHADIPGKDYFNWTARCLSAGDRLEYVKNATASNECVNNHDPLRCQIGDLFNKHGAINIAGKKKNIMPTMKFFTDPSLPLSGRDSIVGRSIVIYDDHAPLHRGERLACTAILRQYRHRAVARQWFGNNGSNKPPSIDGRIEFVQETSRSMTHSLVDLHGMHGEASAFHVHEIPVQDHLEFPCTGDAVGGHFNPFNVDASASPKPSVGTPDQYEVGDLSGKYGLLSDMTDANAVYNDTNLSLFGPMSIVGRSIVVHKKSKAERWACASIGWGFDPDEAREVRAIASFHHPDGFAWGYIRFSQVIYYDGSMTDTTVEVRLKYPGKTSTQVTTGHGWSIYVNPVGHDAAVKHLPARCTAAGYRWNPTHVQLADPNDKGFYAEECGPDQPLRCEVGDLSGRHGTLTVGGRAYVLNDANLPLAGDWFNSALGKSVVVHAQDGSAERMACANIEEDKNIIKYATVAIKAGFNLATFMEEVQVAMGVPEWFVYTDSRKTKTLYNGRCVQILVHFAGPHASKLEQDFNRLLRTGRLDGPSIEIPGFVRDPSLKRKELGYRECGTDVNTPLRGGGGYTTGGGFFNDLLYSNRKSSAPASAVVSALALLLSVAAAALRLC